MILKALYDYYYRSEDMARPGLQYIELAFLIVIDKEGNFERIEDCRIDAKRCKSFSLPKAVKRTSSPIANFCWDNCSYVLGNAEAENSDGDPQGHSEKDSQKERAKNAKNHATFLAKIQALHEALPENKSVKALQRFYGHGEDAIRQALQEHPLWNDLCKNWSRNISFRINGEDTIIPEDPELLAYYDKTMNGDVPEENKHICLVTGEKGAIVQLTSETPIEGSKSNAKLVSFKEDRGYDSYGKTQAYNAPISPEAEFAYTTALRHLLRKGSTNMFKIGTRTYLFWASANSAVCKEAEESFFSLFNLSNDETDDPDRGIRKVEKVFKAIFSGELKTADEDKFFILGLAPNAARLAVVYWAEIPLREFAGNILRHFEDMDIIDTRPEKRPYKGVYNILAAVTRKRKEKKEKEDDEQPNLGEAVVKSIFQNIPYPYALYTACLRRIAAEQKPEEGKEQEFLMCDLTRAAIIKAYLNRLYSNTNKITAMLDKKNENPGYVCGRLFATLEYVQKKSSEINSVRERYMNAASTAPASVFGTLMNLSVHHEEKLDEGILIWVKKLKNEIIDLLSADGFPARLDIQDQGRFFVGYYHQMAEFYRKKEDIENVEQ